MSDMRIVFPNGQTIDVTSNATPNRPGSDRDPNKVTNSTLTRNTEVPNRRDTKRTKIIWPERKGKVYGVGGSTGYRAARDINGMIYARNTGCVTLEEYNQFKGRK